VIDHPDFGSYLPETLSGDGYRLPEERQCP